MSKKKVLATIAEIAAIALFLFWIAPLILVVVNSAKSSPEIIMDPMKLPENWGTLFSNIQKVFADRTVNYSSALVSSIIITVCSLFFIVLFAAMAAWVITRRKSKLSNYIYYMFIAAMVIPFQVVMYPLVSWFRTISTNFTMPVFGFSMLRSYPGIVFAYIGFGMSMSVFMFCGFVKGIPYEIEEAAEIDGCSKLQTFNHVVLPMLKPIIVTVTILNGIWIWNDFLLPLLVLGKGNAIQTIPLAVNNFVGAYTKQWDMVLTSTLMAIFPVLVIFLLAQKQIIQGMVEGSIKS